MAVEPTGILSLPLARARTLLCNSSAWQTWVKAESAAEAEAHVRFYEVPKADVSDLRPWALIAHSEEWEWTKVAGGAGQFFPTWSVVIWFEAAVPEEYQADSAASDAAIWFTNKIGAIFAEMLALSGGSGYPDGLSIKIVEGPWRPEPKIRQSEGDWFGVIYEMTGGIR